jgi:hypothetical protein
MMDYKILNRAEAKVELCNSVFKRTRQEFKGFLIGDFIGNIPLIEDVFFIDFDKTSIDLIYQEVLQTYGHRLLGAVFIGCKKFDSEWFIEDIILEY